MKQKLTAMMLCIAVLVTAMPTLAFGAEVEGELAYRFNGTVATVTGLTDPATKNTVTKITIPATVADGGTTYTVEEIEAESFADCTALKTADMSGASNLKSIGSNAFAWCSALQSLDMSGAVNLDSIVTGAFYGLEALTEVKMAGANPNFMVQDNVLFDKAQTKLLLYPALKEGTSYQIPTSVSTIGAYAFAHNQNVVTLDFSAATGLTTIENNAFVVMKSITALDFSGAVNLKTIQNNVFQVSDLLTKITLPTGLENLGNQPVMGCEKLTEFAIDSSAPNFAVVEGVLYDKAQTTLLAYPPAKAGTHFKVPATVNKIAGSAFQTVQNLTHVAVGNGVTQIGVLAFAEMPKLTSLVVGSGVTSVGFAAFSSCPVLKDVLFLSSSSTFDILAFDELPTDFTLHGIASSTAQTYAGAQSPVVKFSAVPVLLANDYYNNPVTYDKKDGDTLSLVYTDTLNDTATLKLGGKTLTKGSDFTLQAVTGGAQIILSKALMQSLQLGEYTFTLEMGGNTASAIVVVTDGDAAPGTPGQSPATGDSTTAPVAMMLGALALLGAVCVKKRKTN